MPVIRLKKSLDTKPKPTTRRLKETEGRVSSSDRVKRTQGRFPSSNGRDEKTESDIEYHKKSRARQESKSQFKGENRRFVRERNEGEVEKRGGLRTEKSVYQFKGENRRFIRGRNEGEVEKRGGFRTELDHRRRSRDDDRRDFVEDKKPPFARSWNRNPSATEGMNPRKDFSYDKRGKYDNPGHFDRKPSYGKRRSFEEEDSDTETDGGEQVRDLRGYRVKKGVNRRGKDSSKSERRGTSVEVSHSKLPSEGRKRDEVMPTDRRRGDTEVKLVEKHPNGKDKSDRVSDQKPDEHQARAPKPRNRIASPNKTLDDGPATTPPKKRRKRIRLDPYDISNKRLVDSVPENDQNHQIEKSVEKEGEIKISMNAQFRAIQPSPTILSFVEDNLIGRRRSNELRNAGYYVDLSAPLDNIPFSSEDTENPERQRIEENVFRNKLEFFAAAKISSSFPPPLLPEIAFAGRSNVGKSSLLNALTRQWGVVRTSDKPGYTQTINFFRLASKLCLVDLPGYGFAYAKEEVKDAWEELVKEYVSTRVGLERVCLLIDTKWGMKPRDHELIDLMERSQTPYQIVLTKTDAVFPIDVARRAMQIGENLKENKSIVNPVMMVSSKSGAGIRSLRTVLSKLGRFIKP